MKKVTLKDIAKELNVTIGTVSHALNGMDDISPSTKKRVFETAKKLGYISNHAAVSLRSGKTNTIAVIVPDISNPHIAHQIKLIEDAMKQHRYSVIIFNTNEDDEAERHAILSACGRQVDGIMLCPAQHSTDNVLFLKSLHVPFVLIGRYFAACDTDYVCADDVKGGRLAGEYLLAGHYKAPVYVGTYPYIEASINRYTGLSDVFVQEIEYIETCPNPASGLSLNLSRTNYDYDSVVAFSDLLAFRIAAQLGRTPKRDIPVIGFDAITHQLHIPFQNVSIGMVGNGWADKAVEILLNKINGSTKTCQILIDVALFS